GPARPGGRRAARPLAGARAGAVWGRGQSRVRGGAKRSALPGSGNRGARAVAGRRVQAAPYRLVVEARARRLRRRPTATIKSTALDRAPQARADEDRARPAGDREWTTASSNA